MGALLFPLDLLAMAQRIPQEWARKARILKEGYESHLNVPWQRESPDLPLDESLIHKYPRQNHLQKCLHNCLPHKKKLQTFLYAVLPRHEGN